jgi:hypothetical protein
MMVVLTLCSANYLAHAKALGQSLAVHDPAARFVIGLVDRMPCGLGKDFCAPYEVIAVEDLDIPDFPEMVRKYNVVELNTAVKPFYIEHLFRRDAAVESVVYIDPDILVYGNLDDLRHKLRQFNLVVTPHSCTFDNTPVNMYYEIGMLSTGVYNLGFLGTSRSDTTFAFLKWWQRRLVNFCFYEPGSGIFTDQLWITLAPLYFGGLYVEKSPGYNMAYWNHFERRITRDGSRYLVNGSHPLVCFHFSSYDPDRPDLITARLKSYAATFSERPDLKPIYDDYRTKLLSAGYESVKSLPLALPWVRPARNSVKTTVKEGLRSVIRALPLRSQVALKRAARFTVHYCLHDIE